jgi:hypothetical protein
MNEQVANGAGENLTEKIKSLQNELGYFKADTKANSAGEFLDDYGNDTWYVKNLTNTHVVLDIEGMEKISKNAYVDLLAMTSLENIQKSQSIRKCFNEGLLKRITPAEFFEALTNQAENKKRAEYITRDDTKDEVKKDSIRIVVKTKVEKYKGFLQNGIGITTTDFLAWIQNEPLSEEEVEYCMSATTDKDIRTLLIRKKQDILR